MSKWYEVLEEFKIQKIRLRLWAKNPQNYSIMTFNGSFERVCHEEIEFDNDIHSKAS